MVVVGSGAGLVDAAGAGLISGSELIRYAASLDDDGLASAATDASMVIVTDSNRRQAHEWRGSRDVTGFTEDGAGEQVLTADLADHRLAVFAPIRPADQTTARQDGPIRAVASGYGDPTTYRPEDRADQAIDGNLATAWRVGDRAEVLGERLRLDLATPTTAASAITVVQPQRGDRSRWITSVRVTTAAGSVEALLDESSRSASGQHIVLPPGSTPRIEIEVTGTNVARQRSYRGWGPVGFAEVRLDGTPPTEEVVSLPTRVPAVADGHLTVVLTRLRADPHDRWRSDPEPTLVRDVTLASTATLSPQTALRLNPSVDDATLDRLLGLDPALAATSRLPGSPDHAAWAAVDGDPTTSWISAPDPAPGVSITLPQPPQPPVPNPVGPELRHFDIHFLADEFHSRPTHLTLLTGGRAQPVEIPAVVDGGTDVVGVDLDAPLVGSLTIRVDDFTPAWSSDSRTGEETALPIGIAEITGLTQTLPATIPSTCEAGALQIDGKPIGLRPTIAGTTLTAWLSGTEVPAVPCEPGPITLAKGVHQVAGTSGSDAWNLDRVVLGPPSAVNRPVGAASTSDAGLPASTALPATKVVATSRTGRTVEVGPCPSGCWLVLGEGWNRGWVAKLRGGDGLGTPQVVDGGFNGWWIEPSSDVRTVEMTWTPQRTIWFGFTLTLFTLALSVVILVGARSRAGLGVGRQTSPSTDVTVSGSMPVAAVSPAPIDRRRRRWSGVVGAGVLGSLVLSGRWGAMAALIVAVATLIRRRHLVGWLAFAIVAAIACWYGWRIHQLRPFPGYGWVVNIEAAHPWAILAIVLLAVALSDRSQT